MTNPILKVKLRLFRKFKNGMVRCCLDKIGVFTTVMR